MKDALQIHANIKMLLAYGNMTTSNGMSILCTEWHSECAKNKQCDLVVKIFNQSFAEKKKEKPNRKQQKEQECERAMFW